MEYSLEWNLLAMTDKDVITWLHETLGVGYFWRKPPGKGQLLERCNTDGDAVFETLSILLNFYGPMPSLNLQSRTL